MTGQPSSTKRSLSFFVSGASKTMAEFESAFGGLTLPSLDGPGLLELLTDPFDVGQTSTFRLNTP